MSGQDERIIYFSSLCEQLYNPKSTTEGEQVQRVLEASFPTFSDSSTNNPGLDNLPTFGIRTPTDTANALRILLENSPNPYVQTFALSRLKQLVLAQFTLFDRDTKIQLRTFLLEYAFIHYDLQPFVINQLASVLALLTRFGWLDHEEYQQVYKDMTQFLQASAEHRIVGLQILAVIVQDMNSAVVPKYAAKFRKASAGLRDTQLFDIFKNAFELLKNLISRSIPFELAGQEDRTKDATLDLLCKCLLYDFSGTTIDESGEETGTIQIPSTWRPLVENDEFLPTFFKAYDVFQPAHAKKVMDCLVQIVATRKGMFSGEDERTKFITTIMQGIRNIILSLRHIDDADCYNGFCRLLQRFRTAVTLNDLAEMPGYIEWIELVGTFTQNAFQTNTSFHLLRFWYKIVEGMSYFQQLGEKTVKKLQEITVQLVRTFMTTHLAAVGGEMMWDENPLEEEDSLVESLSMLGQIARCQYEQSCAVLIELFDPIAADYQEFISQASMAGVNQESIKEAIDMYESKFAWLVYFMAVFIGNRPAYLSSDESDAADGELITKAIQLMETNQALVQDNRVFLSKRLDTALVYFFSQYRRSYVGEANAKEVYKKPNEVFGIEDQSDMLNLIMRKIITNLQCWGEDTHVIWKTLDLFNELASGYSALKSLRKIESMTLLMQNHLSTEFTFLHNSDKHQRNRMLYYQILCKILFAEDNNEAEFYEFMKPFEDRLNELSLLSTREEFQQPQVQRAIIDLFLDLRGFIEPIQSRRSFLLFFDWFYPDYMPILLRAVEAWSPDPLTYPLLKFVGELVQNKSQRLNLDISSPNGVLLFRDASQLICSYGQQAITQHVTDDRKKYAAKYKGITICFNILARCLGGKYINFGVFWLYQDKAISDAFSMMFQMILNIPLNDMMNFPKLTRAFFLMVDEFSNEQMMIDPNLPAEAFLYILEACEIGIESSDPYIRTHACTTLNNILTFVVQERERAQPKEKEMKKRRPSHTLVLNYFNQFPQVLPRMLTSVFGMILFDDNNDQWQLSRPLYTLVLLERDFASKYTNQVIMQQLPERREYVTKLLSNLMEGSGWTLGTKDREKFSQQISNLKRELVNHQITLVPV
ncbi:armadillo-type protein [Rhizopus microsporus]|uniref:Exportin-7/Ran-binding protein 17 TPR repeats domain-containing protein n=2 Tax=Rhizopus TaxID=4842 RepID=A0A1X0S832_RHIZD|nr:hypothetical protein G6F69_000712 [Rhizopus microsporus]KAG1229085.1 hypothetical protein G6F67_007398 [Rhizopus microsporus]ORE20456.1 hypothetical protein BCV71DRAFT_262096 [Rhizopus microsporus]